MPEPDYSIREYIDWQKISLAIEDEIHSAQEKKTEYTLYDGKRGKTLNDQVIYTFLLSGEEKIDPNNITEIRYRDEVIENAYVLGIKGIKARVAIPQSFALPKRVKILMLISDPSFILRRLLEHIEHFSREEIPQTSILDAVLGSKKYLHGKYDIEVGEDDEERFNSKQKEAIKKSKTNPVLFIWGPPGTGKTTILGKIISDYVKNGESVLLCSNTNRAVDVSILKALAVSDVEQTPIKEKSLRWGDVFLTEESDLHYVTVPSHYERLLEKKRKAIREEVDLLWEYDSFGSRLNELNAILKPHKLLVRKLAELEKAERDGKINMFQQQQLRRVRKKLGTTATDSGGIKKQIDGLEAERNKVEERINEEYQSLQDLREYVAENTRVTMGEIISKVRFQSATFARAILEEEITRQTFDNVLIDETSMANVPYIIFLLTLARKRVIFVGDPQQLEPIVLSSSPNAKHWLSKDIFMHVSGADSIDSLFRWQSTNSDISVLLQDQYRMPKKIYDIVNKLFYKGNLVNHVDIQGTVRVFDSSLMNPPLTFPSNLSGSPVNVLHAEVLLRHIQESLSGKEDMKEVARDIGVMVPFTQQKRFLQYQSKIRYIPDTLEIGVIHTFQGREKPHIYMDLTLSSINYTYPTFDERKTSLLSVSRLLNVGISRCQANEGSVFNGEFILIANYDYFKRYHSNGIVWDFLEAVKENADEVIVIDQELDPFAPIEPENTQARLFVEESRETAEQVKEVELEIEEIPTETEIPKLAKRQIEKDACKITYEIRVINGCAVKLGHGEFFRKTDNIEQILTDLPITICHSEKDFNFFIGMLYKLIYEASGGKEARYPIFDRYAKLGQDTYGKIRLVIHQLRQYFAHDYSGWSEPDQKKLLNFVDEFFNSVVNDRNALNEDDWMRLQLAIMSRVVTYLQEITKKLNIKLSSAIPRN